jgi:hypothetical protein
MRFVAWNEYSDWSDYYANVHNVRRISRTKWEVFYTVPNANLTFGYSRHSVLVIADHAWIEVI